MKRLVTLFSLPAPCQRVKETGAQINTVRTHMHKASLTALAAGIRKAVPKHDLDRLDLRIVDLQIPISGHGDDVEEWKYGEIDLNGLILEKLMVGRRFESAREEIASTWVLGVSCNFTHSRGVVRQFVDYVRTVNKKCMLVAGGSDATADEQWYLDIGFDVVVKGEGELSFSYVLSALLNSKAISGIDNISYVDEQGNHIANQAHFLSKTGALVVDDLDPPALDMVDISRYSDTGQGIAPLGISGPFISIETSRGCGQACSFCSAPITKGRYRYMSSSVIRKHFEYLKNSGVRAILFQEDNVLSRIQRNKDGAYVYENGRQDLLDLMAMAREFHFCWEFTNGLEFGQFYGPDGVDHELVDALFFNEIVDGNFVGCFRATIPLEIIGDQEHKFRKLKPLGQSLQVIRYLLKTGVNSLTFNIIIGRPSDDEKMLVLTYERCKDIKRLCMAEGPSTKVYFAVFIATLLPGTLDYRNFRSLLYFDIDKDPEMITVFAGCMNTEYFTPREITEARGSMALLLNSDKLIGDYDSNQYITSERFMNLFARVDGMAGERRPFKIEN